MALKKTFWWKPNSRRKMKILKQSHGKKKGVLPGFLASVVLENIKKK